MTFPHGTDSLSMLYPIKLKRMISLCTITLTSNIDLTFHDEGVRDCILSLAKLTSQSEWKF